MDIKYLNTFKTIIDTGSFQNTAEKLNYSASTITFQVQQLEQELCIKLFEKIGRKMVITSTGKELLPYIDKILENMNIIENYNKDSNELCGELKVAMPESILTYKSQKAIKLFREQSPKVKLSLQTENCSVIRDMIACGDIDFGIHYDIGGYSTNVTVNTLAEYELNLICSPDFKDRDFYTKHQSKDVCIITDDKKCIFFNMFLEYLKEHDITCNNILELGSIEAIKRSVASNVGIAMLPLYTVEDELKSKVIDKIDINMKHNSINLVYGYHKNKWISRAMESFICLVKETIK